MDKIILIPIITLIFLISIFVFAFYDWTIHYCDQDSDCVLTEYGCLNQEYYSGEEIAVADAGCVCNMQTNRCVGCGMFGCSPY